MPAKHCAYGICRSDNRYTDRPDMAGIHFILFPKFHKQPEKCTRWVRACRREGFTTDKVNKYTYICSKHFIGGNGPSLEHPDPIPATYTFDQCVQLTTHTPLESTWSGRKQSILNWNRMSVLLVLT
ncbi:uncharacterized protein LOC124145981 isoform X2 [Haliotis rufescens]|nr:uncharacterized protein LOC124114625 isoform X2 [Haliotis rufescens]XP_048247686.1 uncharacterized protein LOC125377709 isoform X2 [Haliotis rufescens]XP_048255768.1 uncharacterized protein LOC124145981 isoform X2 [Haliotis rufescens]